jgi:spore maturation protein B
MKTVQLLSQLFIPVFIFGVILYGVVKKVRVYDSFVSGGKEGVRVVVKIFPYLLAIFVAIKSFQASGAFDFAREMLRVMLGSFDIPLEAISMALIKPLSGSASLGLFTDIVKTAGPDSFASRLSAVIMGSAETTFYVLAVYLGAVGIKKTRYLVPVCLVSDAVGILLAILIVKWLF